MSQATGDGASFETHLDQHRRELRVHCYRMLGSFEDAEDMLQETFLRAWTKRATFDGDNLRAWLYRIATNACLDQLRRRSRTVAGPGSLAEVPWLQPFPDRLLDHEPQQAAPREDEPDAVVISRETIELAFVAAIQLLPAQQRAVVVMREVIGWSAAETAAILDSSLAAVNSALQRARATLRSHRPSGEGQSRADLSADERELLDRYITLHERPDIEEMAALVRRDIRVTMPPEPICFDGWATLAPLQEHAFGPYGLGDWRALPTAANRMPAAACYLRERGDTTFRAYKLDVLRYDAGLIAEITTFDATLFDRFGLPTTL